MQDEEEISNGSMTSLLGLRQKHFALAFIAKHIRSPGVSPAASLIGAGPEHCGP